MLGESLAASLKPSPAIKRPALRLPSSLAKVCKERAVQPHSYGSVTWRVELRAAWLAGGDS